jgi:hypothetical protein
MTIKLNNGTEISCYPAFQDDGNGIIYMTGTLNQFQGLNTFAWQVLKSAAGYYVGCLTSSNYAKDGEDPNWQWEPNMRDSDCYWPTRQEAEDALISRNYPIKF